MTTSNNDPESVLNSLQLKKPDADLRSSILRKSAGEWSAKPATASSGLSWITIPRLAIAASLLLILNIAMDKIDSSFMTAEYIPPEIVTAASSECAVLQKIPEIENDYLLLRMRLVKCLKQSSFVSLRGRRSLLEAELSNGG